MATKECLTDKNLIPLAENYRKISSIETSINKKQTFKTTATGMEMAFTEVVYNRKMFSKPAPKTNE